MTKALSDRQLDHYRRDGCLFPLPAFLAGEAAAFRAELRALEMRDGGKISARTNRKPRQFGSCNRRSNHLVAASE